MVGDKGTGYEILRTKRGRGGGVGFRSKPEIKLAVVMGCFVCLKEMLRRNIEHFLKKPI